MESGKGQDRLSSLPDDILTEILSRLPIKSAITTSVLSHHWRHLWTGVTRLEFCTISTFELSYILRHLTSPKLEVLNYSHNLGQDTFRQKLLQVISSMLFPIPDCLLNNRSLVTLDLIGPFARGGDAYKDVDIQLPNLKKLSLRSLTYLPHWLGSLHKCCPLLEDLTLRSCEYFMATMPSMNIFSPNLKSLELGLVPYNVYQTPDFYSIFSIDAPKLTNLVTYGCVLPYGFRTKPTALVKVCIDLRRCEMRYDEFEDLDVELHRFSEFFKGIMTSVTNLELVVQWQMNIFTFLNVDPPMFFNLVRLKMTLCEFSLNNCNQFLVSLQCFPNLEHLWLILPREDLYQIERKWCAPNVVPASCLISKLKTISLKIKGLARKYCWLSFLSYILGNAAVLQTLNVCLVHRSPEREERKFCKSLFKLPRSSLTCEVVFSGKFITLSSNEFKIGKHVNCRRWLIDIFSCYF